MRDVPWWTETRAPLAIEASSSQLDIEAIRDRVRMRRHERVATVELAPLDARKAERDTLARDRTLHGRVVHLHRAHAHLAPVRGDVQRVALGDGARPQRSGRDRPDPAQREDAVDVEPRETTCVPPGCRIGDPGKRGAEVVEPGAGLGAHRDDLDPRNELARFLDTDLERLLVDQVCLRHRDDATLDAEQPQDRQVLERLRPRALGCVDDEEEQVDPRGAGNHRSHEALVPGDVDEREPPSVGQLEGCVAEVDRDPAALLLRQPVRVLAGQGAHEPRLAVVDVPGGADRQRHLRRGGRSRRRR